MEGLGWLRVVALVSLFAVACGGPIGVDGGGPAIGGLGEAKLALEIPTSGNVDRIEYTLTFTFLESDPPVVYNREEFVSELHGGELVAVLPCWTERDGDGLNQVDIEAKVYFEGEDDPLEVSSSSVFTCVRNADVLVNVVLNVVTSLDAGFGDLDVAVTGTLCASKVDFKGDEYQGVCAGSSCGGWQEVFLFANTCLTLHGQVPEYWVCGAPTDWVLRGTLANSLFPIPDVDGSWDFGVIALEPLKMLQVDPTLTDAEGNLKVWGAVSEARARLERSGGDITTAETASSTIDFAAELQVPPVAEGQPSPKLLLTATVSEAGIEVGFWLNFGDCDMVALGATQYSGLRLVDVRLEGESTAKLLMADPLGTIVDTVGRCSAIRDTEGQPAVECTPATPLSEEAD